VDANHFDKYLKRQTRSK